MFRRTPKPVTLTDDIRVTRKSGIRTAILVTLLVSGIVPAFSMFWGSQEGVPFTSHLSKLASVVLHTYPLTVAIAVITLSRKQKWLRWGKWFFAASVVTLCASLGNAIGEVTGHGVVEPAMILGAHSNPIFGIPAACINNLAGFYREYGFGTFVAAILVGTYAGTTASRFLRHVPKERREAIALAQSLVDIRRAA